MCIHELSIKWVNIYYIIHIIGSLFKHNYRIDVEFTLIHTIRLYIPIKTLILFSKQRKYYITAWTLLRINK